MLNESYQMTYFETLREYRVIDIHSPADTHPHQDRNHLFLAMVFVHSLHVFRDSFPCEFMKLIYFEEATVQNFVKIEHKCLRMSDAQS